MAVFETFSKRKKAQSKNNNDVYIYDILPEQFRNQVIYIWEDALGTVITRKDLIVGRFDDGNVDAWNGIHKILCREMGTFALGHAQDNAYEQCVQFIQTSDTEGVLDIIDLSFRWIDKIIRKTEQYQLTKFRVTQLPDDAIDELNNRFMEHRLGYQYSNGQLMRIDSQLIHKEVIKPVLSLLRDENFRGAEEEFLKAYEHYRHDNTKEALTEALKSLESTLKGICNRKKWTYSPDMSCKALIDVVFKNNLIPKELESHFSGLRATLESGVPALRNKRSAHGQGEKPVEVPQHVTAYGLHLTASAIVFLVESLRKMK